MMPSQTYETRKGAEEVSTVSGRYDKPSDPVPEGTAESSPPLERRVGSLPESVPEARLKHQLPSPISTIPLGRGIGAPAPGVKTPGYYQASFQDARCAECPSARM